MELSARYNPKDVEDKWLKFWEGRGVFHAKANPTKKPFCIVIPPPNITGILHMGHALNNTLQDILVRYKRMAGYESLWMPGTDHAGIATQNVVEKKLAGEGKKRQDIGREEFVKLLWQWREQYGDTIIHQLKKLGSSCDWERTRFTMDKAYSEAVKLVFVKLYEKGLIYRGQRIINWCPRCQTALSDEETQHKDVNGSLYHIRYSLKDDPSQHIVVATTRPETMLGDTAVAVNPKDKRYKKLVGKSLILPLIGREIKMIADSFVDPKFGTGAVKVTPAHDPNDFAMGKRHNLEFINILHPDAKLNDNARQFAGLDRFAARKKIVETLKEQGLLEKVENHAHAVGHCYRCDTVVEPYLSLQWFVKMGPLAKPAIDAVKKGKIKFTPERWTKVYLNWMENIQDWCISRQIWWGHRIPVWYCQDCQDGLIVAPETPVHCPQCKSTHLKQDDDVLDTWFSSWLWPFATLNWPQKNDDLKYFYPTTALFTASEIIFFWVARMVMAGIEFMGDIPFSDVYIHGTVRDARGQKMSKSLGNAIDPLEIINEFGADALRFSLIINSGQDLYIAKEKFEIGRNFANKIWNASRLILMNLPDDKSDLHLENLKSKGIDLPTQWILSRFYSTVRDINKAMDQYHFSEAETILYDFFWKNFCDWYLEISKDKFSDKGVQIVLYCILEQSLRLLHPFMPYLTEELWHTIQPNPESLAVQEWPAINKKFISKTAEAKMSTLINIVGVIRNIRAQWNVDGHAVIGCYLKTASKKETDFLSENAQTLKSLCKINPLTIDEKLSKPQSSVSGVVGQITIYIPLFGIIDIAKEKERILNQIKAEEKLSEGLKGRLTNKSFLQKAPKDVVEKEKDRLQAIQTKIVELKKNIKDLG